MTARGTALLLCLLGALRVARADTGRSITVGPYTVVHEGRGYAIVRGANRVYRALPAELVIEDERIALLAPRRGSNAPSFVASPDGFSLGPGAAFNKRGWILEVSLDATDVLFNREKADAWLARHDAARARPFALAALATARAVQASKGARACADALRDDWATPCDAERLIYLVARIDLALGHPAAATMLLQPLVEGWPVRTYQHLRSDPTLASLLTLPIVTRLAPTAAPAGEGQPRLALLRDHKVLVSQRLGAVAVYSPYTSGTKTHPGVGSAIVFANPIFDDPPTQVTEDCRSACVWPNRSEHRLLLADPAARALAERLLVELDFAPDPKLTMRKEEDTLVFTLPTVKGEAKREERPTPKGCSSPIDYSISATFEGRRCTRRIPVTLARAAAECEAGRTVTDYNQDFLLTSDDANFSSLLVGRAPRATSSRLPGAAVSLVRDAQGAVDSVVTTGPTDRYVQQIRETGRWAKLELEVRLVERDGRLRWAQPTGTFWSEEWARQVVALAANEIVYLGQLTGQTPTVLALDAGTGTVRWRSTVQPVGRYLTQAMKLAATGGVLTLTLEQGNETVVHRFELASGQHLDSKLTKERAP